MGPPGLQGRGQPHVRLDVGGRRGGVLLTVKLTAEEREIAQLLPYVSRARYVGRYGWVTAQVTDEESLEAALEWVRESYWLKAPAELRGAVEVND